jgi:hypothetical protein
MGEKKTWGKLGKLNSVDERALASVGLQSTDGEMGEPNSDAKALQTPIDEPLLNVNNTQTGGLKTIAELVVKRMLLSDLKPHPQNPRIHPKEGSTEWEVLRKSLDHDYFDPIVFNKRNGFLVSGHLRTKVLTASGYTHADCVIVDYDDEVHFARMIAANKSIGKDDKRTLRDVLSKLTVGTIDISLTGFSTAELEKVFTKKRDDAQRPGELFIEELMEQHNYVVLYFDNEVDWKQAETVLGIQSGMYKTGGFIKRGIARVLNGPETIAKLLGQSSGIHPEGETNAP